MLVSKLLIVPNNMANFLNILMHGQFKADIFLQVLRDFRKGGVNPKNYDSIISIVKDLKFSELSQFELTDISKDDLTSIIREINLRGIEHNKKCWHPDLSNSCDLDKSGNLKISAAHSIQNKGILNKISHNGHVMTYSIDKGEFKGANKGKSLASIFYGFCNKHDAIFNPIEMEKYNQTIQQNFLFAYRGFVISAHKKIEGAYLMNFGEQYLNDINETKNIFDNAILNKDYDILETVVIELPAFYPIATSSSFYLDFDFENNSIPHSDDRMEMVFISLFPSETKSYFILSYFKIDKHLYGNVGAQLKSRNKFKSDITMLIGAHVENVYFNPIYYETFIAKHEESLKKLKRETQYDFMPANTNQVISMTPDNYLENLYEIDFFGY